MWSIERALSLFIMEFIEKDVYRDASGLYYHPSNGQQSFGLSTDPRIGFDIRFFIELFLSFLDCFLHYYNIILLSISSLKSSLQKQVQIIKKLFDARCLPIRNNIKPMPCPSAGQNYFCPRFFVADKILANFWPRKKFLSQDKKVHICL